MSDELVANFTLNNTSLDAQYEISEGEQIEVTFKIYANAAVWGTIEGNIVDQTDLIDLIDTKIDIEATARENNDLLLQNGINTLNDDLAAEISNRGTADGILQGNIDTLSGTVSDNYTTLDGKIGDNKTSIDNHITDKTNPHEVTKAQVGLGNVDNTSDLNKPISTATQQALDGKVPTSRTVNGKALTSDITLTASDVDALPDSTTIGNGTLTIQKNGSTIDSFGANDTGNKTVNITVPITASDVNALPDTTKYAASMNLSINSSTYVVTAQLKDQNGDNLGTAQTIDLPLESVVVSGSYDSTNKKVVLTLQDGSTIEFSVADLVSGLQTEITSSNKLDADLVDDSTSVNKFATSSQLSQIATNTSDIGTINNTIGGYGDIVTHDADEFATSSQGALADTAVQPADLSTVATTGDYDDLTNKPTIPDAQIQSDWNQTITTAKDYIKNKPTIPDAQVQSDWSITNSSSKAYIKNKPNLANVATSGSYNDLTNKPTIPAAQVQSNWNETDSTSKAYIKNKPTIPSVGNGTITVTQGGVTKGTFTTNQSGNTTIDLDSGGSDIEVDDELSTTSENPVQNKIITNALENKANKSDLSTVATTGDYDDLSNKPTIPAEQVNSDWNATSGKAQILNKPSLSTVATSGSYNDLADKPTIPSAVTESTVAGWGFTKNTGTVTSVNNIEPINGNVTLSIPQQVQSDWNETDTTSKAYIQNKPTIPDTSTLANTSLSNLTSTGNNLVNTALNTRDNSTRLKFWTGTKAQYDAISTKDSNTLYNITDDQDITLTLLQTIYPVGSVYLSTNATCPLASLFGTWTLVSSGKALWTGTGSNGGTTISAGLPNITGGNFLHSNLADGSLYGCASVVRSEENANTQFPNSSRAYATQSAKINASLSNPIYGNSTTVQPPAYVVNVWRRTA